MHSPPKLTAANKGFGLTWQGIYHGPSGRGTEKLDSASAPFGVETHHNFFREDNSLRLREPILWRPSPGGVAKFRSRLDLGAELPESGCKFMIISDLLSKYLIMLGLSSQGDALFRVQECSCDISE